MALAAAFCCGAMGQDWTASEQPNLPELFQNAPELDVEEVGDELRSTTRLNWVMAAPHPDGEAADLIQWYFRGYSGPTTGFVVDTATHEVHTITIPDNLQIHLAGTAHGLDGKMYLTIPWGGGAEVRGLQLMAYDPATKTMEQLGVIDPGLGGMNRPMTLGTNGKIYGTAAYGQLRQAGVYEIDTDTGEITVFGPIGPEHNGVVYTGYVAADDRYIYVATRNDPRYILCYDRETGESKALVEAHNVGGSITVSQGRYGATGTARNVKGADDPQRLYRYWLYQGQAIVREEGDDTPPWPVPEVEEPHIIWPDIEVFNANVIPDHEGNAELWYLVGEDGQGETPEERGWMRAQYQVPIYPRSLNHIMELQDGGIFGVASPGYQGGNFIYHPDEDETEYLGKISGLSQYCRVEHDGKVFMSGYPSAPLLIYDTTRPWTANQWLEPGQNPPSIHSRRNNPWHVEYMRRHSGKHYARAAFVGADGKIYFSGVWARDAGSGGLSWWNPETEESGGFWEDLSNIGITHMTTTDNGRLLVMAGHPVTDRLLGKPGLDSGQLVVYDIEAGEITNRISPILAANPRVVAGAGGTRVIGIGDDKDNKDATILFVVDTATGEIAFRKPIPASGVSGNDFRVGPDGNIYAVMDGVLVRILVEDATVEVIGRVGRATQIAFSGGDIYIGGEYRLRRVRGVYEEE